MLAEILKRDPFAKFLLRQSNMPEVQFDVFLIENKIKGDFSTKIILKNGGIVKKGAYYRSLKQCKLRLRRALYTVLLLDYFDLVNLELLKKLLDLIARADFDRVDLDSDVEDLGRLLDNIITQCLAGKSYR